MNVKKLSITPDALHPLIDPATLLLVRVDGKLGRVTQLQDRDVLVHPLDGAPEFWRDVSTVHLFQVGHSGRDELTEKQPKAPRAPKRSVIQDVLDTEGNEDWLAATPRVAELSALGPVTNASA